MNAACGSGPRFNAQGIDGLIYRPRCGRPRKLTAATIESEILPLVDDPSLAGQLHWTSVKLSGWLKQEKPFDISYRTLVRVTSGSSAAADPAKAITAATCGAMSSVPWSRPAVSSSA